MLPIECEPEIVYAITISPVLSLITFDDSTKTVFIAATSDPNEAGIYTVTVTSTIGSFLRDTKNFVVTIFDCGTLTIDTTKFTSPAISYTIGSAQQVLTW